MVKLPGLKHSEGQHQVSSQFYCEIYPSAQKMEFILQYFCLLFL